MKRAAIDLAIGGVDMGSPQRSERNLKICISNNARLFEYDTKSDRVRLLGKNRAAAGRHGPAKRERANL